MIIHPAPPWITCTMQTVFQPHCVLDYSFASTILRRCVLAGACHHSHTIRYLHDMQFSLLHCQFIFLSTQVLTIYLCAEVVVGYALLQPLPGVSRGGDAVL